MLKITLESILQQNYKPSNIVLVISDDGFQIGDTDRNQALSSYISQLKIEYPLCEIIHNQPATKGSKQRNGDAKAGNLNSALEIIKQRNDIDFMVTQDADDIMLDSNFLSIVGKSLIENPELAYIQTAKESFTSKGDPFSNNEITFYQMIMHARNYQGTAFSCGSGVVYRKKAIIEAGGFPGWNLVEDATLSHILINLGWKNQYLNFVGAKGQIAPEDMQNYLHQRITWAHDQFRLLLYKLPEAKDKRHIIGLVLPYLFTIISTLQVGALTVGNLTSSALFPQVNSTLLLNLIFQTLAHVYFARCTYLTTGSTDGILNSLKMQYGMSFEYLASLVRVLHAGNDGKPAYSPTRKEHKPDTYYNLVLPNIIFSILISLSLLKDIAIEHENIGQLIIDNLLPLLCLYLQLSFIRLANFVPDGFEDSADSEDPNEFVTIPSQLNVLES